MYLTNKYVCDDTCEKDIKKESKAFLTEDFCGIFKREYPAMTVKKEKLRVDIQ